MNANFIHEFCSIKSEFRKTVLRHEGVILKAMGATEREEEVRGSLKKSSSRSTEELKINIIGKF